MSQRQNDRASRLMPGGVPRWIRVYDNGGLMLGGSIDRYCCVFTGRYTHKTGGEHWFLSMSAYPFHPQGVGMHSSGRRQPDTIGKDGRKYVWPPAIGRKCHLGCRVKFGSLPVNCQRAIMQDYLELWDLAKV